MWELRVTGISNIVLLEQKNQESHVMNSSEQVAERIIRNQR